MSATQNASNSQVSHGDLQGLPRLIVIVEEGIVQWIRSEVELNVEILDWDNEGERDEWGQDYDQGLLEAIKTMPFAY